MSTPRAGSDHAYSPHTNTACGTNMQLAPLHYEVCRKLKSIAELTIALHTRGMRSVFINLAVVGELIIVW